VRLIQGTGEGLWLLWLYVPGFGVAWAGQLVTGCSGGSDKGMVCVFLPKGN
jgi:hypothetical protein